MSPGLLYRYFPSKRAVVLALYDELSAAYAVQAERMPAGRWRDRFLFALETSLDVLRPHRTALKALVPMIVSDSDEGVFAAATAFSRARVKECSCRPSPGHRCPAATLAGRAGPAAVSGAPGDDSVLAARPEPRSARHARPDRAHASDAAGARVRPETPGRRAGSSCRRTNCSRGRCDERAGPEGPASNTPGKSSRLRSGPWSSRSRASAGPAL